MTSSPALNIEPARGRLVYGFWWLQLLMLTALFVLLPRNVALLVVLSGLLLLVRAWPPAVVPPLQLRADGTARLGAVHWSTLRQAQMFLGVVVIVLEDRQVLWIWPDMLGMEQSRALRRWLKLHPRKSLDPLHTELPR